MADIFDEIEEDLKRDKLDEAWKKYGAYIIGAALFIVVSVSGYSLWQYYTESQRIDQANRFDTAIAASEGGNVAEALAQLKMLAGDANDGYRMLSQLEQASLMAQEGRRDEAVALYDQITADGSVEPIYQGLALVLSVMHQSVDGDPKALLQKLAPELEVGAVWYFTAQELAAGLALKAGDREDAIVRLKAIVDAADAPRDLQSRATEILQSLEG